MKRVDSLIQGYRLSEDSTLADREGEPIVMQTISIVAAWEPG